MQRSRSRLLSTTPDISGSIVVVCGWAHLSLCTRPFRGHDSGSLFNVPALPDLPVVQLYASLP